MSQDDCWSPVPFWPHRVNVPKDLAEAQKEILRLTQERLRDQERWLKKTEKLQRDILSLKGTLKKEQEAVRALRARLDGRHSYCCTVEIGQGCDCGLDSEEN